jgi:hypothetical protein
MNIDLRNKRFSAFYRLMWKLRLAYQFSGQDRYFMAIYKTATNSCCSRRWGETISLNCGHQQAYCSSSRWYMSVENHGGMILTGENWWARRKTCPHFVHHKFHMDWAGREFEPSRCEATANRLSFGTAYSSLNSEIIKPWGWNGRHVGQMRCVFKGLFVKLVPKRPLWRPKSIFEDNIKIVLK